MRKYLSVLTAPLSIVAVALALRIGAYFKFQNDLPTLPDAAEYLRVGNYFFETGLFTNVKMMPFYPIVASLSAGIGVPELANIVLSSFSCYILYLLSLQIAEDKVVASLAAYFLAFFPFPVYYALSGLSETLFVFLILTAFLFLYRNNILWASIFLVASILTRPTLDLLAPILIILFGYFVHRIRWQSILSNLVKYGIVYLLLMTPWWILNYNSYGRFVRLNLGFGEMLYGGNSLNNISGRANPEELDFTAYSSITDSYVRNEMLVKHSIRDIRSDLGFFAHKSWRRFKAFWNIVPNHDLYRGQEILVVIGSISLFLFIGAFVYFILEHERILIFLPVISLILYLTLIHSITIGSIRYRYPLEPFLMIFAAAGLLKLFNGILLPTEK